MDWLSRLFEMMPVHGRLDLRCFYGAPWQIDQGPAEPGAIPYHAVLAGAAVLDDPARGRPLGLWARDILPLSRKPRPVVAGRRGAQTKPGPEAPAPNIPGNRKGGARGEAEPLSG